MIGYKGELQGEARSSLAATLSDILYRLFGQGNCFLFYPGKVRRSIKLCLWQP